MDQPTAERALKEIEVLVGERGQTATPAGGEPWPGEAKARLEWLEGGQLLLPDPGVPAARALRAVGTVCDRLRRDTRACRLLALVPLHGTVVIVEDSRELAPNHPHAVLIKGRPTRSELGGATSHCACVRTGWWDKG